MTIEVDFQDGRNGTYSSFKEITCLDYYNYIVYIYCSNNNLTKLPELPDSLEYIDCSKNQLTELPTLPTSLKILNCQNNQLNNLPELQNSLESLDCYNNELAELPELPDSLKHLYCGNNKLNELPRLPKKLNHISCFNNQITELPTLPTSLEYLDCSMNNLTELPLILPYSIETLIYFENPICIIINHFDRNLKKYQEWRLKKYVHKIENWFLECKWNPKYAYCRRVVNQGYDDLNNSV